MNARRDTCRVVRFHNRNFVVKGERISGRVTAAADEYPGDLKTAMARGMKGIDAGQQATLSKIWFNLYGDWATIRVDGVDYDIDVRPYNLILQDSITILPGPEAG